MDVIVNIVSLIGFLGEKRVGQKNKSGKSSYPETGRQERTELRQLLPQRAVLAVFYYHAKILSTLV